MQLLIVKKFWGILIFKSYQYHVVDADDTNDNK